MLIHEAWILTAERAAVHLPSATAVIADVHLGYDYARQGAGEAVPSFSLDETIAALARLLQRHPVRRLVIAGDLLENGSGEPLLSDLARWLRKAGVRILEVVPGNHDRILLARDQGFSIRPNGVKVGQWQIVHGDRELPKQPVIFGHFHPCVRHPGLGRFPCYLAKSARLMLPAFSADAAGVSVAGDPRWRSWRCIAIVGGQVLDMGLMSGSQTKPGRSRSYSRSSASARIPGVQRNGYQYRKRHQS